MGMQQQWSEDSTIGREQDEIVSQMATIVLTARHPEKSAEEIEVTVTSAMIKRKNRGSSGGTAS